MNGPADMKTVSKTSNVFRVTKKTGVATAWLATRSTKFANSHVPPEIGARDPGDISEIPQRNPADNATAADCRHPHVKEKRYSTEK